ncbi:MAG: hypothetical protein ABID61_04405 [Candidatus Micrarchaeota archaeon]
MKVNNLVLIFLLVLVSFSFANSPPPPPSQVTVYLVNNGVNETSINQIIYHCTLNVPEEINVSLECNAGVCINDPYYMDSSCSDFPEGYFTYDYQGQNKSSENFNATEFYQTSYNYQLDVQSGSVTSISSSDGDEPVSPFCGSAFFMFAVLMGFVVSIKFY